MHRIGLRGITVILSSVSLLFEHLWSSVYKVLYLYTLLHLFCTFCWTSSLKLIMYNKFPFLMIIQTCIIKESNSALYRQSRRQLMQVIMRRHFWICSLLVDATDSYDVFTWIKNASMWALAPGVGRIICCKYATRERWIKISVWNYDICRIGT